MNIHVMMEVLGHNIHFVQTAKWYNKYMNNYVVYFYYNLNKIYLLALLTKFIKNKKNYVFIIFAKFFFTRTYDGRRNPYRRATVIIVYLRYSIFFLLTMYMTNANLIISKYIYKHPSMIIYSMFSVYYKSVDVRIIT